MRLTRRQLLLGAGAAGAMSLFPVRTTRSRARDTETITLSTTVVGIGTYTYLPFEVPTGINRVTVSMVESFPQETPAYPTNSALGIGLFDERGPGYQSPGFRGVYGEERNEFFVAAHEASQGFLPGPIRPGTWTVMVPVFRAPQPTEVTITVTLTRGPELPAFVVGPAIGVVRDEPGWYRGDLHWHTVHSSDAFNSGSALDVAGVAERCREVGLDFAAVTDHNVVSQNLHLRRDAGNDVLLIAGEEMTNWFHGHATVSGLEPGAWLDWRQRPQGVPLFDNEARIGDFLGVARELDTHVAAAHPFFAQLSWQFYQEAQADPSLLPTGIEVWTGQFTPDCEAALAFWDSQLQQGRRLFANGGSDLHGEENDQGFVAGTPTTVVFAERLAEREVVAALQAGRSYVTRRPDGVEVHLAATGPRDQAVIVGGTVYGEPTDVVEVVVTVRRAAGMRLHVVVDGLPPVVLPIATDDETFTRPVPIGVGGYVRVEVHGEPFLDPAAPIGSRLDMEAFTNPIFRVAGPVPDDAPPPVDPTPPPASAPSPTDPAPSPAPDEDATPSPGRDDSTPGGGPRLPATGGGLALLGAGAAAGAGVLARLGRPDEDPDLPVAMTLSEVVHRAGTGTTLEGATLDLVGRVTSTTDDGVVVSRWVEDCCHERQVDVAVRTDVDAPVGIWLRVTGTWVAESGVFPPGRARDATPPVVAGTTATVVPAPPTRRDER